MIHRCYRPQSWAAYTSPSHIFVWFYSSVLPSGSMFRTFTRTFRFFCLLSVTHRPALKQRRFKTLGATFAHWNSFLPQGCSDNPNCQKQAQCFFTARALLGTRFSILTHRELALNLETLVSTVAPLALDVKIIWWERSLWMALVSLPKGWSTSSLSPLCQNTSAQKQQPVAPVPLNALLSSVQFHSTKALPIVREPPEILYQCNVYVQTRVRLTLKSLGKKFGL